MYIIAPVIKSSGAFSETFLVHLVIQFDKFFFTSFPVGEDFVQIWQTLVFDSSTNTTQCVYIPIINDDCVEDEPEEFTATLRSDDDCVSFGSNSTTVSIFDDDCECLLCGCTTNVSCS